MKNTYPGIKIPKKTIEPFNFFVWFGPWLVVAFILLGALLGAFLASYFEGKDTDVFTNNPLLSAIVGILSLAALVFLFCYSIFCVDSAVGALTQKWGESYREYGPEYTQYTVDIKDISGDKITGSVKSEVTRDDQITLAGCGRFLLWITYFIWSIPAYLILRFKFRVIFSAMKNRRAAGVCQYCGGDFRKYTKPTLRKYCQDCPEKKDYIRIIPRKK